MRRVSVPADPVAVIGAGASSLVLELVDAGYQSIDAVDIAPAALAQLADRLGERRTAVRLIEADARHVRFDHPIAVWHDRATFHFLTDASHRAAYARTATAALRPGGWLILATFSPRGPEQCSGLPVARHSATSLATVFDQLELVEWFEHDHLTPAGVVQPFLHALLQRPEPEVGDAQSTSQASTINQGS